MNRSRNLRFFAFVAVVAGLAAAISPSGCAGTPPCTMNSECTEGVCVDGECVVKCRENFDCRPGYFCNELDVCER